MGTHFGSIHLRTEDRARVLAAIESLSKSTRTRFFLAPPINGWTTCYPEHHGQDDTPAKTLAAELRVDTFHVLLHDSDVFAYNFFRDGELEDEYVSQPDYFSEVSEDVRKRQAGNPPCYRDLLDGDIGLRLAHEVLVADAGQNAEEQFTCFAALLGLPNAATCFEDLLERQTSGIKRRKDFVRVPDPAVEKGVQRSTTLASETKRLATGGLLLREHIGPKGRAGFHTPAVPVWCPDAGGGFIAVWSGVMEAQADVLRYAQPWDQSPQPLGFQIDCRVYSLAVSPSGRYLAAGFAAGLWEAQLWHLPERRLIARIPAERAVEFVGFTADESTLIVRSEWQLAFYAISDGRCVATAACEPNGRAVALHPSKPFIVVANGTALTILDAESKRAIKRLLVGGPHDLSREALLQAQHRMLLAPSPEAQRCLDELMADTNRPAWLSTGPDKTRGSESTTDLQFSSNGQLLACATTGGARVYAWDALLSEPLSTPPPVVAGDAEPVRLDDHYGPMICAYTYACCFDEARGHLLFCGMEGKIKSLGLRSGEVRTLLDVPGRPVVIRMRLDRSGKSLCCSFSTAYFERRPKSPHALQFWNYPLLAAREGSGIE